jgi:hypothetical protein
VRIVLALFSMVSFVPQHMGSGDSVQARDTESVIESITPALPDGVKFSIVGADTFVRIESRSHEVQVNGYENEPYIRINKSGRVQVNDSSQTTFLNSNRYGFFFSNFKKSDIPKWRTIATNGVAMWHDHRSHWMNPIRPATIDDRGTVLKWSVPVVVDGAKTTISGTLYLRAQASGAWWLVAFVSLLAACVLAVKKPRAMRGVVIAISFCGVVVGAQEFAGLPSGARITPILLLFSLGASLLATAAWIGNRWRMPAHVSAALSAGAGAALLVAVWQCVGQVRAAYIPGLTDMWTARATLTAMVGVGIVAIADAFLRITKSAE